MDEDNLDIEDLDSILDDCLALGMPSAYLHWHYRSRHESLIAFSNQEFYENSMLTFPSVNDRERRVSLVKVDGVFDRGKGRVNEEEAKTIVAEIRRRYENPELKEQTIGVVTFNISQQPLIEDLLQEASDDELVWVCKLAQADDFVQQFPDRYDTYIEQGGANVSGGQKQRLCIARALLKKPKILILDDSTSAVDTKTDALIRKALREEIPDTTKIIIAQRASSVEDADVILVMDGGKIVEQGTHEELLEHRGIYWEVYDSQNKSREAG